MWTGQTQGRPFHGLRPASHLQSRLPVTLSLWDRPAPACELRPYRRPPMSFQILPPGRRRPRAAWSTCTCLSLGSYFDHDAGAREGEGPFCELDEEKHEGSKPP